MRRACNALVSRETCARVARKAELGPALRLSASSSKIGGRETDSILAGATEALMAALYQDGGLDAARKVFLDRAWADEFDKRRPSRVRAIPRPRCRNGRRARAVRCRPTASMDRTGPDHAPVFTVEVTVKGVDPAIAKGKSRQEAEKAAAKALLEREGAG